MNDKVMISGFTIPSEMAVKLDQMCKKLGRSRNDFLRQLIDDEIERHEEKNRPFIPY